MTTSNDTDKTTLQALRRDYELLKKEYSFRLAGLEEENRIIKGETAELRKERDAMVGEFIPKQNRKNAFPEFPRNLAAFPLPAEILRPLNEKPVSIIDVGAFKLDGQDDLYADLFSAYPSEVFGFEPQNDSIVTATDEKCHKTIFPWAIGDGEKTNFFQTKYQAASSTLEPNHEFLHQFLALPTMLEIENQDKIETKRLDDIQEITDCDLLKIDVQGGELKVLEGATKLLSKVSIVMTEVEFAPIYKNQPLFSDIDSFLRGKGFFLLELYNKGYASFEAGVFGDIKSRLMWADAVYIKEPQQFKKLNQHKLLKALLITHIILHDPSLSCLLLEIYDKRNTSAFLDAYREQMFIIRRSYQVARGTK